MISTVSQNLPQLQSSPVPLMQDGWTVGTTVGTTAGTTAGAPPAEGFGELFSQAFGQLQAANGQAQAAIEGSLVGSELSMVETMSAVKQADIALKLMIQVRNKLMDAYQELQNLRF